MRSIRVVDSHTGGEATRVVVDGGPDLGRGSLAARLERFRAEYDHFRSAIVGEPSRSESMVGALLCESDDARSAAAVIFFDAQGYLGMCGHGTIGLAVTLAWLGRIEPGVHRIETPAGPVTAELHDGSLVTFQNVTSFRWAARLVVDVPGHGPVTGDVAWGGNWFFVVEEQGPAIARENVAALTDYASRVRTALKAAGVTGEGGAEVDHVALFARSPVDGLDSRNFVLWPGDVYDRSPCGTGTSARLACLAADGSIQPGEVWRQESITGSVFEARFTRDPVRPDGIRPQITGAAYVIAEATLILDERDPLAWGARRPE